MPVEPWEGAARVALALTALEAGLSYGHALQAAGKRELGAAQLMHFQTRILGPYKVGAAIPEVCAMAAGAVATWKARQDPRAAMLASAAVVADGAAWAVWAIGIQPLNKRLSVWSSNTTDENAPADWESLRDRWHRLHALRLVLLAAAAGALAAMP